MMRDSPRTAVPCRRSRGLPRRGEGAVRRTIRTLLLLSLWHAPVPWVHAHDLTGPTVDLVYSLHRHVDKYHVRDVQHGALHLDLHTHLILPWSHERSPCHAPGC